NVLAQNQGEARRSALTWRIRRIEYAQVIARTTDRVENCLARRKESESVRPSVIVGRAVGILWSDVQSVGSAVGGAGTAFVRTVLADEHRALQRMIVGSKSD